jgi:hypothetical protein
MTTHTPQFANDIHRTRWVHGKCVSCLMIQEHAYCIDDFEFMYNCSCGAKPESIKRVEVREI